MWVYSVWLGDYLLKLIFYNYYAQSSKENLLYYLDIFIKYYDKYIKDNLNSNISILDILDKMMDDLSNIFRDNFLPVLFLVAVKGYLPLTKIFEENFKNNPELKGDLNNLTKSLLEVKENLI